MDRELPSASILIAEDERGPREVLEIILSPFFTIHAAETRERVLEVLEMESIDIVTLDLRIPGSQGLSLLKEIKEKYPDVELIIITGDSGPRMKLAMENYDIAGYILKPFDIEELLSVMDRALRRRSESGQVKEENVTHSKST